MAANGLGHVVAALDILLKRRAAQIQIPVAETDVLPRFRIFGNFKRARFGRIQDVQSRYFDFYITGRDSGIARSLRPRQNFSFNLDDIFVPKALGLIEKSLILWMEDDLNQPGAIAQVTKKDPPVIAATMDP